jgi:AcrR family transcriptional regulator
MARWQPDAGERLRAAALDLFAEQGFDQTSVAQIAGRAELTERTFYRYFGDKREVLFKGQEDLSDTFAAAVEHAPAGGPLDVAVVALGALEPFFSEERRPSSRRRQVVIEANPELVERERAKLAQLTDALGAAFRGRGLAEPGAGLAAGVLVAAFHVTFGLWVAAGERRGFAELGAFAVDELRAALVG